MEKNRNRKMNSIKDASFHRRNIKKSSTSSNHLLEIMQESSQLPTDEQITVLANFMSQIVQACVEGSSEFMTPTTANVFFQFIRHHARLTLGEMLSAIHVLVTVLRKCQEKNDNTLGVDNIGTALVCIFIVSLKFLRDIQNHNPWWAETFKMNLETINESEIIILQLMDWKLWTSDKNFIHFYSRVFKV
ncbi:MAG: hypothetical protein EZS28_029998 [Streblomastix strix]|uniref:Cyclin N-terminal domain-containing protein n=1 Tax=Streblomastix strix TaxID=222440 RepID=A0A5J4UV07_9EUKA|nr:MAG: hypothetical protein EZS28_029998 [Streblomastix strix]